MLCREALELTAWDVYVVKALAKGTSFEELEENWEQAESTRKRLALALALNADDNDAVEKWRAGGKARRNTITAATKGIHTGVEDYRSVVNDARLATSDLAKSTS
ncbi:hypothetical protein [Mycobacterium sp.]|uniref:hypothetical protein n=1 Tax=Mycobacterium sp. TaxID=1785 RepID=UPI003BAE60A5